MIKIYAGVLFFLLHALVLPQSSDSLFYKFVQFFEQTGTNTIQGGYDGTPENKCAFELVAAIKLNFEKFDKKQQNAFTSVLGRPQLEKSIVSPAGIFRIHYSETGNEKPAYSVDDFAAAADSAFYFETNNLGYPLSPDDNNMGGDNLYDIYIRDLGIVYGFTTPEDSIGNKKYTSFISVDNDFSGSVFFTHGLNAARVTIAHEYHHAIQIGNYGYFTNDNFYYELTSTSMEDFVFDYVDDYLGYMQRYFSDTNFSFSQTRGSGYDLAAWNLFLQQRFSSVSDTLGLYIIKRSWELIRNHRAIAAISNALEEAGYSMKTEFSNFAVWNYFTGYRYNSNYFKDGEKYPLVKRLAQYQYSLPSVEESITVEPLTNNYLYFVDQTQGISDTLVSVITNGDVQSGILNPNIAPQKTSLNYLLSSSKVSGSKVIIEGKYYSKIIANQPDLFTESNFFNNLLASSAKVENREINFAYPNPFNYAKNSFIRIPVAPNLLNQATLAIYDASMNNVFNSPVQIFTANKIVVHWNGLDRKGEKLPTGVYLYVTDSDGKLIKGKLVIKH